MYAIALEKFYDHPVWLNFIKTHPLLKLVALEYLFQEYGVANIGGIAAEKVYAPETFIQFGIALKRSPVK